MPAPAAGVRACGVPGSATNKRRDEQICRKLPRMTDGTAWDAAAECGADVIYEYMCRFAGSWGLVDIAVEANGAHIDGELIFAIGADMGFTVDMAAATCHFCMLEGADSERWLDDVLTDVTFPVSADADAHSEQAKRIADGLLAARREDAGSSSGECRD